jgi:hypothetical protein
MFRFAEFRYNHVGLATGAIVILVAVAFVLCRLNSLFRGLVWLTVVLAIVLDAGILVVTLRTAMAATARASGLPL